MNGRHLPHGRRGMVQPSDVETVCAGTGCHSTELVPGSPVPVCGRHLRKIFEFATSLVAAAQQVSQRKDAPVSAQDPRPAPTHHEIARELYRQDTGGDLDEAPPADREEYLRQAASYTQPVRLVEGR